MSTKTNDTAQIAATLATATSQKAVDLATSTNAMATDLATKTAATTAEIRTNIEWMKNSLLGIENKLNEMTNIYVTKLDFDVVAKLQKDHEDRMRVLETAMWKWIGTASVVSFVIATIVTFLMKVLVK